MADGYRLDLDRFAIARLADGNDAEDLVQDVGDDVADLAAQLALKRTGEGAASIQAVVDHDAEGAYADISWDEQHFYMGFAELGTEHVPAQPFLRPALDSTHI